MTRNRYESALPGDDLLVDSLYPGLGILDPVHRHAPARRPALNHRRLRRMAGRPDRRAGK